MPPKTTDKFLSWHNDDGSLKPFKWDAKKTRAAAMVAESIPHTKIGEALGVQPHVISWWRKHPDFSRRVKKIIDDAAEESATIAIAIANRVHRVRVLDELNNAHLQVFEERKANPTGDAEPGMSSGLVVKKERVTTNRNGTTIETEYQIDSALSAEIRALHKQAAQETGQWSEKSEVSVTGGLDRTYIIEDVQGVIIEAFDIEPEVRALNAGENE